jgi:hypothetical protein
VRAIFIGVPIMEKLFEYSREIGTAKLRSQRYLRPDAEQAKF